MDEPTDLVTTTLRVDRQLLEQLRLLADNDNRSVAYLIRTAITQYLNRRKVAA